MFGETEQSSVFIGKAYYSMLYIIIMPLHVFVGNSMNVTNTQSKVEATDEICAVIFGDLM